MILCIALFSVYQVVAAYKSIQTNVTVISVSNDVNVSSASSSSVADTLLGCVRFCLDIIYEPFYYDKRTKACYCGSELNESISPSNSTDKTYGYPTLSKIKKDDGSSILHTYPESPDCLALVKLGFLEDGAFVIRPVGGVNIDVWCDQKNGGWTVIQRRMDGSEDFKRNWHDYVHGFGNVVGEFWLGLENIHLLTEESSTLQIYMRTFGDIEPESAAALYGYFSLKLGPEDKYRLVIDDFNGTCGDSLVYHNGSQFSTYDQDDTSASCAKTAQAGWWFKRCYQSNLNGPYNQHGPIDHPSERGVTWVTCWKHTYSLKQVEMKIKRN